MPLYEFQCLDCSVTFEERRPFSGSNSAAQCPDCAGTNTKKILGTVSTIHLDSGKQSNNARSIPVPMSGGGCGCGGSCACGAH